MHSRNCLFSHCQFNLDTMSVTAVAAVGTDPSHFQNGKNEIETRSAPEQEPELLSDKAEEAVRTQDMADLARRVSRTSTKTDHADSSFLNPTPGSALDPNSPKFSYKLWAKALLNVRDHDLNPVRTSGFAFRNLSVHGFGKPTGYQKTFTNILLEGPTIVKTLLGLRHDRKIQILHDFDGLLHSGELLVVLGPPGSGCSTLLKTIVGETHGIYIDKGSRINYKGISPEDMHSQFKGEAVYTAEIDGASLLF
jgi:ATP-binding cassette subfamily G (WHITE) protein 2 (PDR)